ncbi:MAG: hypothetical protein NWF12_04520 [Candidatus Bathyarchaeota archaeon]|nr:hypothetical protein [Candidatus Bathyarchaeota archaeon]
MSLKNPDTQRLASYLQSLIPPAHVILLYGAPSELESVKLEIKAHEYPCLTVPPREPMNFKVLPYEAKKLDGWALRCVRGEGFTSPVKLIRTERRMQERRMLMRVMCAYPIKPFIGLGEDACVEILSLHHHVLFTRFSKGGLILLESAETAMHDALGRRGAEMIHNYLEQKGVERNMIPLKLPRYVDLLHELLGKGVLPLMQITYRKLFQRLRSSPEMFKNEPRG